MTFRERFVACVLGEPVDRPPFLLYWTPWESTWQRWVEGGKPDDVFDARFAYDPDFPPLPLAVNTGPCPARENEVLEEDGESVLFVDNWGVKQRAFKGKESMPQFLEFPVKNRRDWEKFREERLDPDHPERVTEEHIEAAQSWAEGGLPVQLGDFPDTGIYGGLRWLLGDEECLSAFCTMPDLVHEIMDHLTSLYLTVFEKIASKAQVDVVHMWEDMCGRNGPLIGPRRWEEFMGPCYRRIKAFNDAHNIPIFSVDTDGQPDLIVPCMIDAGVNYLWPMEVAAGCDVNAYRAKYPTLGMMGGIDKRALAIGREAIDAELERVRPVMEQGRYIPDLDHTIPDDVPWENYDYFAQSLKRMTGKE
jgi:Uroporphyrinogen decarboxylase (URO-D)